MGPYIPDNDPEYRRFIERATAYSVLRLTQDAILEYKNALDFLMNKQQDIGRIHREILAQATATLLLFLIFQISVPCSLSAVGK